MSVTEQKSVRCGACGLVQYRTPASKCRRCQRVLPLGSVEVMHVTIQQPAPPPPPPEPRATSKHVVLPMREVVRTAVVAAVKAIGHTTKAARALGITHHRLKGILRDSGDHTDYRKIRIKKAKKGKKR